MTLTVIFKIIDIGYISLSADFVLGYFMVNFVISCPRTYYFLKFILIEDEQGIHMWKYLKTVDFINTRLNTFKSTPFLPPTILPTYTKIHDIENQGQCHFP